MLHIRSPQLALDKTQTQARYQLLMQFRPPNLEKSFSSSAAGCKLSSRGEVSLGAIADAISVERSALREAFQLWLHTRAT
eukprot:1254018-Amphidinium_carterae.1